MNEEQYIKQINDTYLEKHQEAFIKTMVNCINDKQENFKPFNPNPKSYTFSIYEPLQLYYVLLGYQNFAIDLKFKEYGQLDVDLINYFGLDLQDENVINDSKIIAMKRKIDYCFLTLCLDKIEIKLGKKIQLHLIQHSTEVSYDLSNNRPMELKDLMEILEE